ncbi:hypothetical protein BB559_000232 [Furculomyces boomerangus]|uniref:Protein transport protein SFT2 n=1 Tax=Furculomyces boomerangus TaxID=61424 RepID=A0A2T9Z602_9FUNG|nr:hypothetical protein BB559_000232 [Furculomyces boomerangus]
MSLPFHMRSGVDTTMISDPFGQDPGLFGLTRTERLYAFGACIIAGFILMIVGVAMLFSSNTSGFAIMYSIGNLLSLFSLGFLVGFKKQIKMAFAPVRLIAGLVYLVFLILTLIIAFTNGSGLICLIFVLIQFCALVWYSASYIPFGRKVIKSMCGSILD